MQSASGLHWVPVLLVLVGTGQVGSSQIAISQWCPGCKHSTSKASKSERPKGNTIIQYINKIQSNDQVVFQVSNISRRPLKYGTKKSFSSQALWSGSASFKARWYNNRAASLEPCISVAAASTSKAKQASFQHHKGELSEIFKWYSGKLSANFSFKANTTTTLLSQCHHKHSQITHIKLPSHCYNI